MVLIIIGIIGAVSTFAFIHEMSFLGNSCFYVGELNPQTTQCLPPLAFYGLLGVSALFVLAGLVQLLKPKTAPPSN